MAAASRELSPLWVCNHRRMCSPWAFLQVHPSMLREGIGSRVWQILSSRRLPMAVWPSFFSQEILGTVISLGFWLRMNYKAIPGSRYFDDCLMVKLLAPEGCL